MGKLMTSIKKFLRWLFRTYRKEIKKYADERVDDALKIIQTHINTEVKQKIKNEVVQKILLDKVDIYTTAGAETVKTMIDEFIEKLAK